MDSNKPITEYGRFWLRENEQRKLWGTLYVNEANKSTLETFGSLIGQSEEGLHTIVGQISSGQKLATLIDCFPTNTRNWIPVEEGESDWSRQTWLVNTVVEGIGFEKGKEIAFEQATLSISTLPKWANPNIVKVAKFGSNRVNISIEDRADESKTVWFRGEKVKISLRFRAKQESKTRGVITRFSVEDHCCLIIERADGSKMPLDSIFSVAEAMQDLLSICCNETPTVTSLSVKYGKDEPSPAKVYARMRGNDAERKEGCPYPAFGLKDLGGMGGVARWIDLRERYGEAVAFLTSNWYNEKAYNEDKFSRMYVAVEGLLARKKKREKANMKTPELAEFVKKAIPSFSSITNRSPEQWAQKVKEIRDQKIGHSDPTSTVVTDGRQMDVMTNVLYIAGASFLLREMGLNEDQVVRAFTRAADAYYATGDMTGFQELGISSPTSDA